MYFKNIANKFLYYSYHKLITDNKIRIRYGGQDTRMSRIFIYLIKKNNQTFVEKVLQQTFKKYTGSNLIFIRYENDFENTTKKNKIKLQSAKMPSGCISLN